MKSIFLGITAYGNLEGVKKAVVSFSRLTKSKNYKVTICVFDDCTPSEDYAKELSAFCEANNVEYYRTPRNLGIPRNNNLILSTAVALDYDYGFIANSDVIVPLNLLDQMVKAFDANEDLGSITAMANNVSIYGVENTDPDKYLDDQEFIDYIADIAAEKFKQIVVDIPAGISFCFMVPKEVIKEVGLMDPVFGRGYCEETDWTLRSKSKGYRIALLPGTYVFHEGGGSNIEAGLVTAGNFTDNENELIVEMRYPQFPEQVGAFINSDLPHMFKMDLKNAIMKESAKKYGFDVVVNFQDAHIKSDERVQLIIEPQDSPDKAAVKFRGFTSWIPLEVGRIKEQIEWYFEQEISAAYDHNKKNKLAWKQELDLESNYENEAYPIA